MTQYKRMELYERRKLEAGCKQRRFWVSASTDTAIGEIRRADKLDSDAKAIEKSCVWYARYIKNVRDKQK